MQKGICADLEKLVIPKILFPVITFNLKQKESLNYKN